MPEGQRQSELAIFQKRRPFKMENQQVQQITFLFSNQSLHRHIQQHSTQKTQMLNIVTLWK